MHYVNLKNVRIDLDKVDTYSLEGSSDTNPYIKFFKHSGVYQYISFQSTLERTAVLEYLDNYFSVRKIEFAVPSPDSGLFVSGKKWEKPQ